MATYDNTIFSTSGEDAISRTIAVEKDETIEHFSSLAEFEEYYEIQRTADIISKGKYQRVSQRCLPSRPIPWEIFLSSSTWTMYSSIDRASISRRVVTWLCAYIQVIKIENRRGSEPIRARRYIIWQVWWDLWMSRLPLLTHYFHLLSKSSSIEIVIFMLRY